MEDMKISALLAKIIECSKKIGNKANPPFTVERFLLALIDKILQTAEAEKVEELKKAEAALKSRIDDFKEAEKLLNEFICEDSGMTFLDDLYMKKRLQEAKNISSAAGDEEITVLALLASIEKEPCFKVKKVMKLPAEAQAASEPVPIADKPEPTEEKPEDVKPISEDESHKGTVSALVSDTNSIRNELSKVIFGQDNAINVFATGYFQANMLSVIDKTRTRPRATFLFAGPPGVGKTFMAEKAAQALGLPFLRVDMSEYSDHEAAISFIGSNAVYKNSSAGNVTEFITKNPKSVILFDEIEKAHTSVIHLFLQMLDAGILHDVNTKKQISFSQAIIIITTNAGRQLYENSTLQNFADVPRKVIVKALQNDINPSTGAPFFPAAICSRFASGNIVMFNHMSASDLRTIAKKEIERHASNLKSETGIELQVDEEVYTALLFAEGAAADARTIRSRAETFFNDELYELLRLIGSAKVKTDIEDVEKIHVTVDLTKADGEVLPLFEAKKAPKLLVFADKTTVSLCKSKLPEYEIIGVKDFDSAVKALKSDEIGLAMIDMRCGASAKTLARLNIEDVDSPSRDFYRFVREHRAELPIYLIDGAEQIADEEKISFMRQGVRGFLHVEAEDNSLNENVKEILTSLHRQTSMIELARANKLVTFETLQSISKNGKKAEIKLFDLKMSVAIDSEDRKNVLSSVSKPNVSFEDVIGAREAKKELMYFVEYLKNPKKYMGTGVKAPKGVILYGPPGTGKTMLAKAMAKESDVTFIAAEGNQFIKGILGEGPAKVHELFTTARKYAPSILFIDEIDAIAKERRGATSSTSNLEDVLTAFLTEMDGFVNDASKPVFVLAATNYDVEPGGAKSLDPALMRRFDRRVYIELPGKEDRKRFLDIKTQSNRTFDVSRAELENIATRSSGMSLAELDSALELALRSAIRENSSVVTDEILENAFETFNNGETKKWDISQLERVARHEAGHAFMCWSSGETPSYLTVVARGNHGGYMQHADQEGKAIYTRKELLSKIRTSLGGRAAEIAYYGDEEGISTGVSGDLISATSLARNIVCSFGMDEEFGLAVVSGDVAANSAMSLEIRKAVNRILNEQMKETVRIISENKGKIDRLVHELIEKNSLNSAEIEELLS